MHHLFLGPIVSALANKYGCRAVCIAGSIVAALAFTLSTLSTNVKVFFITYGVMGGMNKYDYWSYKARIKKIKIFLCLFKKVLDSA